MRDANRVGRGLLEESMVKSFGKAVIEVRNANLVNGDIGQVVVLAQQDKPQNALMEITQPVNFMQADATADAATL